MSTFSLPDLGEGLKEAEIVCWHVSEGDHVVADQPLLSVETDKAVVEIPAPRSGLVATLHVRAGDVVPIGAALVDINPTESGSDAGTVVGTLAAQPSAQRTTQDDKATKASPAVRALARELRVNLDDVIASGPDGTVTRADVEATAARADSAEAGKAEPLRGVRRAMARNMVEAHASVVPATLTELADIHDWRPGTDTTCRLVRALCVGCAKEPALNASFLGLEQGRRLNDHVDLGIAMDTADGLFVPVLRNVAQRPPEALRAALERMKADVRSRAVPRHELRGATITLSNFGMHGGLHAALVVLPPQVAIIGVGRIHDSVVARNGTVKVRRSMPLSLSFDHRAVAGGEAARFMRSIVADLGSAD